MNNRKGRKSGRWFRDNGCIGGNDTTWIGARSKGIITINGRSSCRIHSLHIICLNKITMNKWVNMPTQFIHIFHHASDTMDNSKLVSKKFLGSPSKLVNTPAILKYFLNCDTIADPVELFSSQVFTVARDCLSSTRYFANEREVLYLNSLFGLRAKDRVTNQK